MKSIVVLTGAGISAESGLKTFRDSGGLWEGVDVMEVASVEGWYRDREKVLEFYNVRRVQANKAQPNAAHLALKKLESKYDVQIITQNVDDLHEKAGSANVLHLHGMLREAKSEKDDNHIIDLGDKAINMGDTCPKGGQLRPNVVWFGEMVPNIEPASQIVERADAVIIIGTSLVVYPAAGLIDYAPVNAPVYVIDPSRPAYPGTGHDVTFVEKTASQGTPELVEKLLNS